MRGFFSNWQRGRLADAQAAKDFAPTIDWFVRVAEGGRSLPPALGNQRPGGK